MQKARWLKVSVEDENALKLAAEELGIPVEQAAIAIDEAFRTFRKGVNSYAFPRVRIGDFFEVIMSGNKILRRMSAFIFHKQHGHISDDYFCYVYTRLKTLWRRKFDNAKLTPKERNLNALYWKNIRGKEFEEEVKNLLEKAGSSPLTKEQRDLSRANNIEYWYRVKSNKRVRKWRKQRRR